MGKPQAVVSLLAWLVRIYQVRRVFKGWGSYLWALLYNANRTLARLAKHARVKRVPGRISAYQRHW